MGLFGNRNNRNKRRDERRTFKLAKVETRQNAHTERVLSRSDRVKDRSDAKIAKNDAKYKSYEVAYENGVQPINENDKLIESGFSLAGNLLPSIINPAGALVGGGLNNQIGESLDYSSNFGNENFSFPNDLNQNNIMKYLIYGLGGYFLLKALKIIK